MLILREHKYILSCVANAMTMNFGNNFKKVLNDYGIRVTGNVAVDTSLQLQRYIVMKSYH